MERYFEINEAGHNIRCKLYCQDIHAITRAVIFCHGFGGHKDNGAAAKFADRLLTKYKKTALITFNLPCHGDDVKKKLSLEDCLTYLELVVKYARERYQTEALYCYATSFGGYLALYYLLQKGNPFRRIVLRCPAVNLYEAITTRIMSTEEFARLEKGKEVPVGFDRKIPIGMPFLNTVQENDIRKQDFLDYAEDILLIHGTADEIISFEEAHAFSEEQLIEFLPIEGADHRFRDPKKMEQAIKAILDFFGL